MRPRLATCVGLVALGMAGLVTPTEAAHQDSLLPTATVDGGSYLVVLRGEPLATYTGGMRAHRQVLLSRQRAVLASVGNPPTLYSYTSAFNGFAAELTTAQVKGLQARKMVVDVQADAKARLDGARLDGIDLDRAALDVREALGNGRRLAGGPVAGAGAVIGVIDSGVWPDNPSFAGVPLDPATLHRRYPRFDGRCQSGESRAADFCNAKIIASRYFVAGFGRDNIAAAEFLSARDGSGHGSHTASIAAGNSGVDVTVGKQHFGRVSGIAPGAALAVYKACWTAPDPAGDGCTAADALKAVDQSIHDGVDVINYSIGQTGADVDNIIDLAFLNAASAGIFVAAAAGNDGPRAATVQHPSPWVTTVAATTRDVFRGAVRLGDGQRFTGSMVSDQTLNRRPLVYARDAPATRVRPDAAALCAPRSLKASAVDGDVVLCDRGRVARVAKSKEVARAGGIAMILANQTPGETDTDIHAVPTVQVDSAAGHAIQAYAHSARHPSASLHPRPSRASGRSRVADFSARGPSPTAVNVLKPEIAAPGASVVAAVAPSSNFGRLWDVYSGTSMAAPKVAGLAAVLIAAHPGWSPAAVKSAMMTTATTVRDAGPLDVGAGDVPTSRQARDPGLVYDAGRMQWLAYRARARQVNAASFDLGSLVGDTDVPRVVTNVSRQTETYRARTTDLRGIDVSVSPPSLTLDPGESADFTVSFSPRRSARYGRYAAGELTWRGSQGHRVTSPIVVRPEYVRAPAEVVVSGRHGTTQVRALAGVTGTIGTSVVGPVAADQVKVSLSPGVFASTRPRIGTSTLMRTFDVPDDTAALRLEVGSQDADLDLYVYRNDHLVASATGLRRTEQVTLPDPAEGRYDVYVNAPPTSSDTPAELSTGTLDSWVLAGGGSKGAPSKGAPSKGALSVAPGPVDVTGSRPFRLDLHWSGLSRRQPWLGAVRYDDSDAISYVRVN